MLRLLKSIFSAETGEQLHTEDGHEIPDPTPVAPPVGYKRNPTIAEQIRDMVRSEQLRVAAEASGLETFEEADDFEIEDDPMPYAPYEGNFDTPASDFAPKEEPAPAPKPKGKKVSGDQPDPVIGGSDPADPQSE